MKSLAVKTESAHIAHAGIPDVREQVKRLIRLPEVIAMTGLSRSEIYRLEGLERFPKRVPLSERSTAWAQDEVHAWVDERVARRDQAILERKTVGIRLRDARAERTPTT